MRVIKLHSLHSIYSKRMLAKYMRCMRNNNLEIRIVGSSCHPQLASRKMLRPILVVLFLSLVVTFCMLCLINILSLNCFCAIKHILIFFYYFYSLSSLVLSMGYSIVSKGEEKLFTSQYTCCLFYHVNKAGTSHGYDECDSWLLSQENRGKVEPKEIPCCLLPCLLVVFIWQLDILVTALIKSNMQRWL